MFFIRIRYISLYYLVANVCNVFHCNGYAKTLPFGTASISEEKRESYTSRSISLVLNILRFSIVLRSYISLMMLTSSSEFCQVWFTVNRADYAYFVSEIYCILW